MTRLMRATQRRFALTTSIKQHRPTHLCVKLSSTSYRCCWLVVFVLQGFCVAYYVAVAALYLYLLSTTLVWSVVLYSLSIDIAMYPVISVVNAAFAAGHLWGIARMMWRSVRSNQLVFSATRGLNKSDDREARAFVQRRSVARRVWLSLFGRHGFFGIESRYFELRVAVLETIEIVTQSYQCYRTSWLLSRVWVLRLYCAMIVINCWTVALIHFCGHRHSSSHGAMRIRVLLLLCDVCLDMLSTIVVPCVLFQTYASQYEAKRGDFPKSFYYKDESLMGFLNEFQLLLVNGGLDFIVHCSFAASLLSSLEIIKGTVQRVANPVAVVPTKSEDQPAPTIQVVLLAVRSSNTEPPQNPCAADIVSTEGRSNSATSARRTIAHVLNNVLHLLFMTWGCVVLYAQLQAESKTQVANCIVAVHPWFRAKPGCALVELDGSKWSAQHDTKQALSEELAQFDQAVLSYLIIRHHAALRIPPGMQNLSNLVGLKLDNVTLVEWEEDAALTNTHHPKLLFLFLVRFNATDIPPGMLSTDFPKLLYDIEICISSLSGLPSDLPSVWPAHMWLYVDHANWTAIPEVMLEMELEFLHLSYNQIHEVPDALFTNPTLTLIALSGNPISALPKVLTKPATEYHLLFLDSTKISELPSWLHANATKVLAGETPFCDTPEHEEMETIKGLRLCSVDIDCRDLHLGSS